MGVVYEALQSQPLRREVALKIIKPGMDSKQVIARFESERQALAVMDHANIARVFDAGMTTSGLPYFAMELVRGVAITRTHVRKKRGNGVALIRMAASDAGELGVDSFFLRASISTPCQ
jgi:serine/threonine protein kinase